MDPLDKLSSDLHILSVADNQTKGDILAGAHCTRRNLSGDMPVQCLDVDERCHRTNWRRIAEKEPVTSKKTLLLRGGKVRKSLNRLLDALRHKRERTSSRRTLAKRGVRARDTPGACRGSST
jgi:hypothetical protein